MSDKQKLIYCKYCKKEGYHSQLMCFNKPRRPIKSKVDLTWRDTVSKWKLANPPNLNGNWICYLQISKMCLGRIDKHSLTLDHVIPKSRGIEYKYDINNLKPCCMPCNSLKGSRTLENLSKDYPQLKGYLT